MKQLDEPPESTGGVPGNRQTIAFYELFYAVYKGGSNIFGSWFALEVTNQLTELRESFYHAICTRLRQHFCSKDKGYI